MCCWDTETVSRPWSAWFWHPRLDLAPKMYTLSQISYFQYLSLRASYSYLPPPPPKKINKINTRLKWLNTDLFIPIKLTHQKHDFASINKINWVGMSLHPSLCSIFTHGSHGPGILLKNGQVLENSMKMIFSLKHLSFTFSIKWKVFFSIAPVK